jgi:hypothetical protein
VAEICGDLVSIRLISETGETFWFTGTNWARLLRFAALNGWSHPHDLDPSDWWDRPDIEFINQSEIVAGARLNRDEAARLADVIEQGLHRDPRPQFILDEVERIAAEVRKELPSHDPLKYVDTVIGGWSRFPAFARKSGFQVDWVD